MTDAVPPLPGDSGALSTFFVVLGVLFPSLAAGSASALVFRRARAAWCVAAPVAAAAVIGVVAASVADGVAGLGHGSAIAGTIALFSVAVSAPTAVLGRIRPPLTALAVLVFLVLGIPASGGPANLASFGPGFLRALGPVLPLGAAASAIRNVTYFGGHDTAGHLWVLAAWASAGLAGLVLAMARRRRAPARPAPVPGPAAGPPTYVVGFDNSEPARRALAWTAIPYEFDRRQGSPADAILSGASDPAGTPAGHPIIVVGRSGHAAHQVIGSVPVRLMHHSPYPVLAIP